MSIQLEAYFTFKFLLDPDAELSWCRVSHFGGWLRLRGELAAGQSARVMAYLHLKE